MFHFLLNLYFYNFEINIIYIYFHYKEIAVPSLEIIMEDADAILVERVSGTSSHEFVQVSLKSKFGPKWKVCFLYFILIINTNINFLKFICRLKQMSLHQKHHLVPKNLQILLLLTTPVMTVILLFLLLTMILNILRYILFLYFFFFFFFFFMIFIY